MNYSAILTCFSLLTLNSCKKEDKRNFENSISYWHQKEINVPDSIIIYHNNKKINVKTVKFFNRKSKLVSFIDNDCSNCTFSQLLFWKEFYNQYKNKDNFELILIYNGLNDYFCNVIYQESDVQLPIILDESGYFIKNNSIFERQLYRTVLLDSENKILLIGDFRGNRKLENLYLEEIDKTKP